MDTPAAAPAHDPAEFIARTRNVASGEQALTTIARRVLPGGGFGNINTETVIARGQGGRIWDESGNEYVDFLLGSGPMFIGHGHPAVDKAVKAQLANGTTFFAQNAHGIRLAEDIVDAVPCAEKVRFLSSGTEADFYAMRLVRAFRGREKILKFEGGYHGMSDYALMSLAPRRPGNFPQASADSAGIPRSVREEILVAPFNDTAMVDSLIAAHHDELAGVIVEPFQRLIPPHPGFLQALRRATAQYGIPLIFDEVVTGFRFAYGGAQSYYGVTPDICTLGKIIGGGFPLAAVTGKAEIMAHFDRALVGEDRFLPQIGTLSGNPVAACAGRATLAVLREPGAYAKVFETGRILMAEMTAMIRSVGLAAQVVGEPPQFDVMFTDAPIADYRASLKNNVALQQRFTRALRARGVFKNDSKYYVSLAHDATDIADTLAAFQGALEEIGR